MSSIEEIKQRKLDELRRANQANDADRNHNREHTREEDIQKLQKEIDAIEEFVKQKFTKDANTRYGNLKTAHPEKALQLITILAQIIQSGSLQAQITDEQLKSLLEKLSPNKKFTITRR